MPPGRIYLGLGCNTISAIPPGRIYLGSNGSNMSMLGPIAGRIEENYNNFEFNVMSF